MIMAKKPNTFFNMQFITSTISTTLVLLLLGMVVFFVLSANNLSTYVRENIGFTVLVSDDMKEPEALKFQETLNEKAYVKESVYISKEQALKEQTEAMGTDPAEFLGYNPFTASIEIKLNAEYANSDSIAWIEKEIPLLNVSEGTRKHYWLLLDRLKVFGRIRAWSDLTVENVYEWDGWLHNLANVNSRKDEGVLSTGTIHNYHKHLKCFQ